MKIMTIASGSSGNCTFVGNEKTSLLVDAGISRKRIVEGLSTIDLQLRDIDGIIITHEHIDHVRALGVISRSCGIPLYATADTCEAICRIKELGDFDEGLLHSINPDERFNVGSIEIEAHSTWHDAADPVCYSVFSDGKKFSIATDMGDYDEYLVNALRDSDALLLEANHDIKMLQAGIYPYHLKQRILGQRGHLSNEACGRLLRELLNDHIKTIFLGHLSSENNFPALAYEAVKVEISDNPFTEDVRDFNMSVASRVHTSQLIEL